MTPIVDRKQARESGFAQVREALLSFEGDVVSAEFSTWPGGGMGTDGKPLPTKDYLEISCVNVKVLEVSEELAMPVDEWNFRVNCSDFKGSFWIEEFLKSADEQKVLIPDGLVGKRVTFTKKTLESVDSKGVRKPQFDSTNYVITGINGGNSVPAAPAIDLMATAMTVAVGKTETQFRSAISLHKDFANSPMLQLAKTGALTKTLVDSGALVEAVEGNKTVYRLPEVPF